MGTSTTRRTGRRSIGSPSDGWPASLGWSNGCSFGSSAAPKEQPIGSIVCVPVEALRRPVEEDADRDHSVVVIELEHIGAGGEGLAANLGLPAQLNAVVVAFGLLTSSEREASDVLGELAAEVDQCTGTAQDTYRRLDSTFSVETGDASATAPWSSRHSRIRHTLRWCVWVVSAMTASIPWIVVWRGQRPVTTLRCPAECCRLP